MIKLNYMRPTFGGMVGLTSIFTVFNILQPLNLTATKKPELLGLE